MTFKESMIVKGSMGMLITIGTALVLFTAYILNIDEKTDANAASISRNDVRISKLEKQYFEAVLQVNRRLYRIEGRMRIPHREPADEE